MTLERITHWVKKREIKKIPTQIREAERFLEISMECKFILDFSSYKVYCSYHIKITQPSACKFNILQNLRDQNPWEKRQKMDTIRQKTTVTCRNCTQIQNLLLFKETLLFRVYIYICDTLETSTFHCVVFQTSSRFRELSSVALNFDMVKSFYWSGANQ